MIAADVGATETWGASAAGTLTRGPGTGALEPAF